MVRKLLISILLCLSGSALPAAEPAAPASRITLLTVDSAINPVVARFITDEIDAANRRADRAVLIRIDTPGGLDSAMREIIQAELGSKIPVIVYVAPAGARAASAGALITLAADFAAMAPGTNIGAAHPVAIGLGTQPNETMGEKVLNDASAYARSLAQKRGRKPELAEKIVRESLSLSAEEALKEGAIDLIAEDNAELLRQLDGHQYTRQGEQITLHSKGAQLQKVEMNWRQEILSALSDPTIAYLLMMLGILGIFFEISQPGVILPGTIGAIAILLALFAFSGLPINYIGLLLILLAVVMFILEIKVPSYGMLSIGGIVAMAFGSLMLIDSSEPYLQISRAVIAATVAVSAGFILFASWMVVRTQKRPVQFGREGMIGERGRALGTIAGEGQVFVHGEIWRARSAEEIAEGSEIEVVGFLPGLLLEVRVPEKAEPPPTPTTTTKER